jgi:hypothetical protein
VGLQNALSRNHLTSSMSPQFTRELGAEFPPELPSRVALALPAISFTSV